MGGDSLDDLRIEIDAKADSAKNTVDELIERLTVLQNGLKGFDGQGMKSALDNLQKSAAGIKEKIAPLAEFEKKLSGLGRNIKTADSMEGLQKQIAQAESRLDSLLSKENKMRTVGGIDENSKAFRGLQYDIADVCGQLDTLYAKLGQVQKERPLNFWEKPRWTDGAAQTNADNQKPQSLLEYAADDVKQSFADIQEAAAPVADSVRRIGEEMRSVGTETDNARQKMEGMGNSGGIARLMESLRSFSVSDVFGRMSAAVRDFQTRIGTRIPTEQYTELAANIRQAETELQRLLDKQDRMEAQGVSTSSASWKGMQYDIRVATDRVAEFNRDMELLRASGGDSQHLSALSYAFMGVANGAKSALNAVKRAGSGFKSFLSKVKSVAGSLLSAGHGMSRFNTHASTLSKSLSRVTTMLRLMVMRLALKAVLNNVGEGFKQLARESTEFNTQISNLMAGCKQLAYSIAALAAPIVNLLGPALNYIIGALTRAVNVVNQFLSALGGKSVFNKAKKQSFDYAASLDKVGSSANKMAKEIRDATIGIDELNIISKNDTEEDEANGGGGSGSGGDYYDTEPIDKNIKSLADRIREILKTDDWSEIGRMIAAKLNEAMAAIPWEKIQAETQRIAKGIGTLINGFVDELDWSLLGYTIGQGINTALIFANTLLTTIDFEKIGSSIATALNSAIETIDWEAVGNLIANGLNMVIDAAYGLVSNFDFWKFGESIGNGLTTAIHGIEWAKAGEALGKAATGLFSTLDGIIQKTDWKALGKGIVDAIGGFFRETDWSVIASALSSAIKGLLDLLTGAVKGTDWAEVPRYIVTSIGNFFKSFDWSGISHSLGELLGSAVKGAIDLCGSIWEMLKEAWGNLTDYFSEYIEDAGGNIIAGLWNGIIDALKSVGSWIKENIFTPFIDGFKEAFGIASPSKEMKTMGGYIVDGLIGGISGKFAECMQTVKEWAGKVKDWFTGGDGEGNIFEKFKSYGSDIVGGFREKVGNTYTTVKDNVTTWASKVKEWYTSSGFGGINRETFTTYANNIISGFREKVGSTYTTVKDNITTWASKVKDWYTNSSFGGINSNTFSTYANNIITGFREKIGNTYTTVKTNITTWADKVKSWYTDSGFGGINSTTFTNYAANIIDGFKTKVGNYYTTVKDNITTWASKVKSWFTVDGGVNSSKFQTFATNIIDGFKSKVGSYYTTARDNIVTWGSKCVSWFEEKSGKSNWETVATNVVDGFKNKIGSLYTTCKDTIQSWGSSIISWFKEKLDINSPSRVFAELGSYTVQGFNKGIDDKAGSTATHISEWIGRISNLAADIKTRVKLDDSAIRAYRPALSRGFTSDTIRHTIQETIESRGAVDATLEASGGIKEAFSEVVRENLMPYLDKLSENAEKTAQYSQRTAENTKDGLTLDGYKVNKQLERIRSDSGFSFTPEPA